MVLTETGIDTSVFSAHSTGAASTSAAHIKGISIDKILATAGWSTESTFCRFYRKPIVSSPSPCYGTELMSTSV